MKAAQKKALASVSSAAPAANGKVAIDALGSEAPAAVELLRYLAYVNADNLPISMLDGLIARDDTARLIEALVRSGMVRHSPPFLSVDRSVQDAIRGTLNRDEEARCVIDWATHLDNLCPESEDYLNFRWFAELAPHLVALTDFAVQLGVAPVPLAKVVTETGISLVLQASYRPARSLLERAMAICEAAYGSDAPEVASVLTNLASVHQSLGEYSRAADLYERALAIDEAAYGPDHHEVGIVLTNLGAIHLVQGDSHRAVELLERALAIKETVYGPTHRQVAITLTNLGSAYQHVRELRRAVEAYERALSIDEAIYGVDHPEVAATLANLGFTNLMLGESGQSVVRLERAVAILEAAYGPDHPSLIGTLTNLGICYFAIGDSRRAVMPLDRARCICEDTYGPNHPETVKVRGLLSNVS